MRTGTIVTLTPGQVRSKLLVHHQKSKRNATCLIMTKSTTVTCPLAVDEGEIVNVIMISQLIRLMRTGTMTNHGDVDPGQVRSKLLVKRKHGQVASRPQHRLQEGQRQLYFL